MRCIVLKDFDFSANGWDVKRVVAEDEIDVPEDILPGLINAELVEPVDRDDENITFIDDDTPEGSEGDDETTTEDDEGGDDETDDTTLETKVDTVIPEDWRELEWPELRSLASDVSDAPIKTKDDAIAAIEAHLATDDEAE